MQFKKLVFKSNKKFNFFTSLQEHYRNALPELLKFFKILFPVLKLTEERTQR